MIRGKKEKGREDGKETIFIHYTTDRPFSSGKFS